MAFEQNLKNNPASRKDKWLVFIILFIALAFRLNYLGFLIPYYIYPDERSLVEVPLNILQTHDLNPHFYKYASFSFYWMAAIYHLILGICWLFQGGGLSFSQFLTGFNLDGLNFLLFYAGRLTAVGFGLGTIYLTYLIGKKDRKSVV